MDKKRRMFIVFAEFNHLNTLICLYSISNIRTANVTNKRTLCLAKGGRSCREKARTDVPETENLKVYPLRHRPAVEECVTRLHVLILLLRRFT